MTATSVVPPPMSTIRWPPGSWIGRPAPIAAAVGSSIKYTSCALAWSAASRTARFSTWVIPDGTPITTRGRSTPQPRRRPVELRRAAEHRLGFAPYPDHGAVRPAHGDDRGFIEDDTSVPHEDERIGGPQVDPEVRREEFEQMVGQHPRALLARPLPSTGPRVAVPAEAPAVHREARPGQRGERLGLAHGTAVPRADLEPPDGAEREPPLHERLQRADSTGEVHVLPAGERRELAPLALRQDDWPPVAEDEPVLRQARRRGPRAVAPNQGEDASPEVRRVHHVDERVRLGATRGRVELAERVGEGVLLAREAFHEVAAHDLAAVFHAEQRVAERGPVALGELSRDDAVAREQQPSARLLVVLGRETILLAQHAPAPDHRELAQDAARQPG